jgi:thioredoxin-related protein
MKKYLILLVLVLISSACRKNSLFTVKGTIKESIQKNIYLQKVDINSTVLIDSSVINSKGSFRFRVKTTEPDFYQVGYSDKDFITLLAEPGEKIQLSFNGYSLSDNYIISGSKGSELVRILDLQLIKTKSKIDSLSTAYERADKEPDPEVKKPLLEQEYLNLLKEQRKFNIAFIINNINSLASIKALYQRINDQTYVLYDTRDLQYLKIVSDSLKHHYPDSRHTKALVNDFEKEMNQLNARQLQQITRSLPETKLDPDLKDINGKRIALSSLKGKYVLLAFWSSESRDCVSENFQLKEFYRIYNRKGFEIYQISLDEDESKWKTAVRYDELPWINTREDNPADPENARLFNVKVLPTNYLFDKQGKIVASNLHGKSLQLKLEQLFTN